jgi:hypothetical protein
MEGDAQFLGVPRGVQHHQRWRNDARPDPRVLLGPTQLDNPFPNFARESQMNAGLRQRVEQAELMVVDEGLRWAVGKIVLEAKCEAARKGHSALFGADAGNAQGQLDKSLPDLRRRPLVELRVGERHTGARTRANSGRQHQIQAWVNKFHLSLSSNYAILRLLASHNSRTRDHHF